MSTITLENILANKSLLASVSEEWLEEKLKKEPYNNQIRALISEKKRDSSREPSDLINEIIKNQSPKKSSIVYIRDIYLEDNKVDASANVETEQKKSNPQVTVIPNQSKTISDKPKVVVKPGASKESMITGAAIGAGAAIVGSIPSLAIPTSENEKMETTEIVSNTANMEKSGLLGFLNRIEGKFGQKEIESKRSEGSSPDVDPMHKVIEKIEQKTTEEKTEVEEVKEDSLKDIVSQEQIVDKEETNEKELEEKALELEESKEESEVFKIIEDSSEQMVFHEKIKKKKGKKKKKKGKDFKQEFRWLSYTDSDYSQKDLDPYTLWINTIDDTRLTKVKKDKKKKKKGKKYGESQEVSDEIISEQLADLLASQGHFMQSIDMYERLSLKNPEKSSFFADKIESIKSKNRS